MTRAAVGLWLLLLAALVPREAIGGGADALPVAYRYLAAQDVAVAAATVQGALEQAVSWDTRRWRSAAASGAVTPLRTFRTGDGRYCRDYLEVVLARGHAPAYGKSTACRSSDGFWELIRP